MRNNVTARITVIISVLSMWVVLLVMAWFFNEQGHFIMITYAFLTLLTLVLSVPLGIYWIFRKNEPAGVVDEK